MTKGIAGNWTYRDRDGQLIGSDVAVRVFRSEDRARSVEAIQIGRNLWTSDDFTVRRVDGLLTITLSTGSTLTQA